MDFPRYSLRDAVNLEYRFLKERSIKAKVLIVGNKRDQLIGRDDLVDHAKVIPGARLLEVDSPAGHAVCCGVDPEATKVTDRELAAFLATLK
jgi:homoserine acetyltransferase